MAAYKKRQLSAVSGNIIGFLRRYIEEHITNDLSLTKLSEMRIESSTLRAY
jgi:hypothetical protein